MLSCYRMLSLLPVSPFEVIKTYFAFFCSPEKVKNAYLEKIADRLQANGMHYFISSCWYVGCATTISDLRTSDCNRFIFSISSGVFSFSDDDPSLSDLSELSDFPRPLSEALPKPESHSLKIFSKKKYFQKIQNYKKFTRRGNLSKTWNGNILPVNIFWGSHRVAIQYTPLHFIFILFERVRGRYII